MARYMPMRQGSVLKWPGGKKSAGKALAMTGIAKLPAALGSDTVTHPGYKCTLAKTAKDWSRDLLDLDTLGASEQKKTGLSPRAKPVVIQWLDKVMWCNGYDAPQIYDPDSGNVYDLGIAAPSAAPGLADADDSPALGTNMSGEYYYAIRWVRSDTGEKSALSALAAHTADGAHDYIQVTWTDPSLSGVDEVEVFRSKDKKVGFFRIATGLDITSEVYNDIILDAEIDISLVPPIRPAPGGSSSTPTFEWMIQYAGRIWGLVGNSLHWSEPNTTLFPATNKMTLPVSRDTSTGFAITHDTLFVSQRYHLYSLNIVEIQKTEEEVLQIPRLTIVDDSTGFASQHAVCSVENTLWFMSGDAKIYQIPSERGPIAAERSIELERTLKRLNTNRLDEVELAYLEVDRKIVAAVSLDDSANNNHLLVRDLAHGGWTIANVEAESLAEFRDADGRGRMVFGNVRGDVCQFGVGDGYGARDGKLTGTLSAATRRSLTISDGTMLFPSQGNPLHIFDENWNIRGRTLVESITSTVITPLYPLGFTPDTSNTWYYILGASFPRWEFGWLDLPDWGMIEYLTISYVPSYGNLGIYTAFDDGTLEIAGAMNMGDRRGIQTIHVMKGGKRFKLALEFLDGAAPMKLVHLSIEVNLQEEGGLSA